MEPVAAEGVLNSQEAPQVSWLSRLLVQGLKFRHPPIASMQPSQQALIASSLGLVAGSIAFAMNTTLNYIAMPCYWIAHERMQQSQNQSTTTALIVHQWRETFWRGHSVGPGLHIFIGFTYLYAAYQVHFSSSAGRLYLASSVCGGAVVPFTIVFMHKINDELLRIADTVFQPSKKRIAESREPEMRGIEEEEEAKKLLHKWTGLSKIRALMPLVAVGFALYALTL